MPWVRRIFHPTDFSAASRPAFKRAIALAKAERAQLVVAHVLPAIAVVPDGYMSPETWNQLERGERMAAQRQLNKLLAEAKRAGVRARGALIDMGVTHERIVRFAQTHRIDLIVMGTHGRSGVVKAILGSVASRVLASARCPVMTVHAQ
ncbi:MAG TPA: universal stress protein [Methylomirabilota bacterium]